MKYTTIFFDLDDTILDTAQNSKNAVKEIFTDYKFDQYFATFDDFWNKYQAINTNLWHLYEHNQIDKDYLMSQRFAQTLADYTQIGNEKSLEINGDFMNRVSNRKDIVGGAIEILEYLKPKYQLHIISNGFIEVQDKKIKNAGVLDYFKQVILSEHVGKNKPHPDIFNYALKITNAEKDSSIMIGDNINTDIAGAKNSGIDQIWFNPRKQEDINQISPNYTIYSLDQIKQIL